MYTCRRIILVVAILASLASAGLVNTPESNFELNFIKIPKVNVHNIIKCNFEDDQTKWEILDSETVSAKGKFLQIVEQTLTYPRDGLGKHEIVCIRVIDLIGDGTGGFPDILDGGLEFHHVTIHFESQRGYGFKFSVEIWGKLPEGNKE